MSSTNSSFSVSNGLAPEKDGPRVMPVVLDFSAVATITDNFLLEEANGVMDQFQSVFVDNSRNAAALTLDFDVTGQRLVIPAGKQGVLPVYSNGNLSFTASSTQGANNIAKLLFANIPQPYAVWG